MAQLFANNISTTLTAPLSSGATTVTVASPAGMPTITGSDYFLLTLVGLTDGDETAWEIVRVTAVSGTTLTVVRAQEGTSALTFSVDTPVEMRLTAASIPTALSHLADDIGLEAALITINGV